MTRTVLVTGACGFVGSHLLKYLSKRDWDVVATDLAESERSLYYERQIPETRADRPLHGYFDEFIDEFGIEFVAADLTEQETLEPLFDRSYDAVFHTASLYDYFADRETLYAVNVEGARNLGTLAAEHGVGHFVHWSTLGVCGETAVSREEPVSEEAPYEPHNRYGKSKAKQEQLLLELTDEAGLPLTVLRPAPIYGPRHTYGVYHLMLLYRKIGTGLVFPIYPRNRQLKFPSVHVRDLVRAAGFVHRNRERTVGEIYHVTSDPIQQDELVRFIVESLGLPRREIPLPWPLYRLIAGRLVSIAAHIEKRARQRDIAPKFPASMAKYLQSDFWFTSKKLKSEGFEFIYEDPRKGLWEYLTWCKSEGLL